MGILFSIVHKTLHRFLSSAKLSRSEPLCVAFYENQTNRKFQLTSTLSIAERVVDCDGSARCLVYIYINIYIYILFVCLFVFVFVYNLLPLWGWLVTPHADKRPCAEWRLSAGCCCRRPSACRVTDAIGYLEPIVPFSKCTIKVQLLPISYFLLYTSF